MRACFLYLILVERSVRILPYCATFDTVMEFHSVSRHVTRDHSASGAVDNRTGNEPIYIERASLIYPSFNAFGLMSLLINGGNINFLGVMSVNVEECSIDF